MRNAHYIVLAVPDLDGAAAVGVRDLLVDLLEEFEHHFYYALRDHDLEHDARRRDPIQPWKDRTPPSNINEPPDFDDEIPF